MEDSKFKSDIGTLATKQDLVWRNQIICKKKKKEQNKRLVKKWTFKRN